MKLHTAAAAAAAGLPPLHLRTEDLLRTALPLGGGGGEMPMALCCLRIWPMRSPRLLPTKRPTSLPALQCRQRGGCEARATGAELRAGVGPALECMPACCQRCHRLQLSCWRRLQLAPGRTQLAPGRTQAAPGAMPGHADPGVTQACHKWPAGRQAGRHEVARQAGRQAGRLT